MKQIIEPEDLLCAPVVRDATDTADTLLQTEVVVSEKMIMSDLTEEVDGVDSAWNMREYWHEEEGGVQESDFDSMEVAVDVGDIDSEDSAEKQYQRMLKMLEEESFFFKRGGNAVVGCSYHRTSTPLFTDSTEELHYGTLREELVEELL